MPESVRPWRESGQTEELREGFNGSAWLDLPPTPISSGLESPAAGAFSSGLAVASLLRGALRPGVSDE